MKAGGQGEKFSSPLNQSSVSEAKESKHKSALRRGLKGVVSGVSKRFVGRQGSADSASGLVPLKKEAREANREARKSIQATQQDLQDFNRKGTDRTQQADGLSIRSDALDRMAGVPSLDSRVRSLEERLAALNTSCDATPQSANSGAESSQERSFEARLDALNNPSGTSVEWRSQQLDMDVWRLNGSKGASPLEKRLGPALSVKELKAVGEAHSKKNQRLEEVLSAKRQVDGKIQELKQKREETSNLLDDIRTKIRNDSKLNIGGKTLWGVAPKLIQLKKDVKIKMESLNTEIEKLNKRSATCQKVIETHSRFDR